MPIVKSKYHRRPWYFFNGHFETIIPSLLYEVEGVDYERERLELEDGDFLDLDWVRNGNKRLMVLSHGLEGSSDRHYIKRPAQFFSKKALKKILPLLFVDQGLAHPNTFAASLLPWNSQERIGFMNISLSPDSKRKCWKSLKCWRCR